ncbi:TPCN3 [Mytilus coruscus]|uniref:TPCN3 n=1 Tax=Mytilus coruscus TaxID=42192 RepID=A0A6J8CCG1_MYTCO|nr:TPCN3 [Mytilus coruscus]
MAEPQATTKVVIELSGENASALNDCDVQQQQSNDRQTTDNQKNGPVVQNGPKDTLELPSPIVRAHSKESLRSQSSIDQQLKEEDLVLATTLVIDAKSGRNFQYKTDAKYVKFYNLYHSWILRWLLYLFIAIDLALAMFEKPANPDMLWPIGATISVEIICLLFFLFRFCHAVYFSIPRIFWRDTKNILILAIIVLTFLDMICFLIWDNVAHETNPIRWSRPLRPLFIINFSDGKQIRRAFRNIRRTVPEILNILVLFFLSIALFALLALKLFNKRNLTYPDGKPYFKDFFESVWDLYVLVTTANNPDVMMPAYDESNWFAFFFIIYIIICLYIFMSIILAAIYYNYRNNLKNEIRASVFGKRKKLSEAFELLKVDRGGKMVVTYPTWCQLLKKVIPKKSQAHIDLLMKILDTEMNHQIVKKEFLKLADLLQLELTEVTDRMTFLEKNIPTIYNSAISRVLKKVVRHKVFRYFFDFLIFVNAWFIGFDVDKADWYFLALFTVEILLKLYTFGPKEFFVRFWNSFDFLVVFSAVIASAIEAAEGASREEFKTLDLLLVLRVLRLVKIFGSIQRFKVVLQTIINIGPSIFTYGGVIFVFYYMFAIIGMEIFSGKFDYYGYETNVTDESHFCGNPKLNGTAFFKFQYCNNNFNDFLKSLPLIASGFVAVTSKAARLYFFMFHLTCVVIVLNIFIAFILEAFILEYTIEKSGRLESCVESKIKELGLGIGQGTRRTNTQELQKDDTELVPNEQLPESSLDNDDESDTDSIPDLSIETGLKFHLKKKSRKKVEVLLQQMFEGEIDPEDDGHNFDEDEVKVAPRKLTLDTVS